MGGSCRPKALQLPFLNKKELYFCKEGGNVSVV